MSDLDPRLVLTALAVLWALIIVTAAGLALVHAVRVVLTRRRDRLDVRARPLVIRFALEDDDPELTAVLQRADGAFGDRVDERLLSVLETLRGDARRRVVELLVRRGHPERLRRRTRSQRTTTRAAAIRRLGLLELPEDAELIERHLVDPAPIVRTVAVRALAVHASAGSVGAVLDQLRTVGEIPTLVIVASLIDQGRRSEEALGTIRSRLGDPRPAVRAACAQALGELTSAADAQRLGLLLRRDTTPTVQLAAAIALERVGRTSSVPALLDGTRSPWGPVRAHSLQALLSLPREVTEEAVAEISRHPDALLAPLLSQSRRTFED